MLKKTYPVNNVLVNASGKAVITNMYTYMIVRNPVRQKTEQLMAVSGDGGGGQGVFRGGGQPHDGDGRPIRRRRNHLRGVHQALQEVLLDVTSR